MRAIVTAVVFRYQLNRIKLLSTGSHDVEFSDALAHMLGFDAGRKITPRRMGYITPNPIDLSTVIISTLYVYCNVLVHVVVGNIMALFLRIVNMDVMQSHAVHQIMNPQLFMPVRSKT